MRKHKRMLAILTAAGILAAGFPHELAQYRKTAGAKQSVLQFADALDRNSKPCNSGQLSRNCGFLLRNSRFTGTERLPENSSADLSFRTAG